MKNFFLELIKQNDDELMLDFCRRKVIHGIPHIFKGNDDAFYSFRKRISDNFKVPFHEVYVVGSAKLGFSPHKEKYFDLDSDIDVAIVSIQLFDKIMEDMRVYQMELRKARRNISTWELDLYHEFLEYVALGWIRPDKLPKSFQIDRLKSSWFDYFRNISYGRSEVGNYKIAAGVFKTYYHLEMYLLSSMKNIRISKTLKR